MRSLQKSVLLARGVYVLEVSREAGTVDMTVGELRKLNEEFGMDGESEHYWENHINGDV